MILPFGVFFCRFWSVGFVENWKWWSLHFVLKNLVKKQESYEDLKILEWRARPGEREDEGSVQGEREKVVFIGKDEL